jgi:hypothetical protein
MEDKNQPDPKSKFAEVIRKGREKREQIAQSSKEKSEDEQAALVRMLREASRKD